MEKDELYLKHILDAANTIENYVRGLSFEDFLLNKLVQDGVVRELEIIGEAVKNLSQKIRSEGSGIPWKNIAGMRDFLAHEYFGVDLEEVWETVTKDLAVLKDTVQKLQQK